MTTMSDEALELYGQIVSSNVDEAARVSNLLIDMQKRETERMAKAFIELYDGIERIPAMIRSSYLDDLLDRLATSYNTAHHFLQEDPS